MCGRAPVLAMVGGVGPYEKVQYNRAHPGPHSGVGSRVRASSRTCGRRRSIPGTGRAVGSRAGRSPSRWGAGSTGPEERGGREGGVYSLSTALAHSVNLVSVRIVQRVGVEAVIERAGADHHIPKSLLAAVPALALGCSSCRRWSRPAGLRFSRTAASARPQPRAEIRDWRATCWCVPSRSGPRSGCWGRTCGVSMIKMMRGVVSGGRATGGGAGQRQGVREDGDHAGRPGRMVVGTPRTSSCAGCRGWPWCNGCTTTPYAVRTDRGGTHVSRVSADILKLIRGVPDKPCVPGRPAWFPGLPAHLVVARHRPPVAPSPPTRRHASS